MRSFGYDAKNSQINHFQHQNLQKVEKNFRVFFRVFNNSRSVLIKWCTIIVVTSNLVIYAQRSSWVFVASRKSGSSWQVLTLFDCFSECITPILEIRYVLESRESQLSEYIDNSVYFFIRVEFQGHFPIFPKLGNWPKISDRSKNSTLMTGTHSRDLLDIIGTHRK